MLRSALAQAVRWEWIWDNPVQRAHRVVVSNREMQPPTPAELETMLSHVAEHDRQFYVFLVLAAFTGARRAQLLGLRWDNVSLAEERVAFRAGWVEGPDGPVLADTKTKQSHVVDLHPGTWEIVASYAATVEAPVGEQPCVPSSKPLPPTLDHCGPDHAKRSLVPGRPRGLSGWSGHAYRMIPVHEDPTLRATLSSWLLSLCS